MSGIDIAKNETFIGGAMIQLTHYDDGKGKYQSHEVSLKVPHGVNNKKLNSYIEYDFSEITGYGETKEEALNDFMKKFNYMLDEWQAFANMLNNTNVITNNMLEVDCVGHEVE